MNNNVYISRRFNASNWPTANQLEGPRKYKQYGATVLEYFYDEKIRAKQSQRCKIKRPETR